MQWMNDRRVVRTACNWKRCTRGLKRVRTASFLCDQPGMSLATLTHTHTYVPRFHNDTLPHREPLDRGTYTTKEKLGCTCVRKNRVFTGNFDDVIHESMSHRGHHSNIVFVFIHTTRVIRTSGGCRKNSDQVFRPERRKNLEFIFLVMEKWASERFFEILLKWRRKMIIKNFLSNLPRGSGN